MRRIVADAAPAAAQQHKGSQKAPFGAVKKEHARLLELRDTASHEFRTPRFLIIGKNEKGLDLDLTTANAAALKQKRVVLSAAALQRTIERLAFQIVEPNGATEELVLIGIRKGGENLARRIHAEIKNRTQASLPVGFLNVTMYRDDDAARDMPDSQINVDVSEKQVVIIDDVLYTGRTVRSALDAITDLGRARAARLCVLIDRGLRELPIQADYTGRFVPTSRDEHVEVVLNREPSDADRVVIYERA